VGEGEAPAKNAKKRRTPSCTREGQCPFEPLQEIRKNTPSGWGQGDNIPLWEFEGNALKKTVVGNVVPHAPYKGAMPL
jgi:hypothetical protein